MFRKLLLLVLLPAVLLIGGYFALQVYLRTGIQKEKQGLPAGQTDSLLAKADTLGGQKVSPADLRPLLVQRLQLLLKKSSGGLYNLIVGDLKIDVLASVISLHNVAVQPDEQVRAALQKNGRLPTDVFTLSFKELLIEGVNLDDALQSKTMDYQRIKLVKPVIEIDHRSGPDTATSQEGFSQRFLKEMDRLSVARVQVEGGTLIVKNKQKKRSQKLENVQVAMNDILLTDSTRTDKSRFLFAREAKIRFQNFNTASKDGLYHFHIGNVAVDAAQKKVTLENLSFGSPLSKAAFVKKQKKAKQLYNLSLPELTISGINWWTALNGDEIIARQVNTSGGRLSVYFNRSLPPANKMGNFPNQLLMKLPLKLQVSQLNVRNLDVSYQEYNPVSEQSGTVYFDKATLAIRNVQTLGKSKTPVTVSGTALFMHSIPVEASFRFDMNQYQSGRFAATVAITKPFSGAMLNSFAKPLGLMKIEKGTVQKLQARMQGNEQAASGTVQVLYHDLKLSLLEKDAGKDSLDKKDVTSFLANLLVLKKDNPKGGQAPRTEAASFRRDPNGGFMMLVWKTVLVGVLKTMGAPEKIAYKKAQKK